MGAAGVRVGYAYTQAKSGTADLHRPILTVTRATRQSNASSSSSSSVLRPSSRPRRHEPLGACRSVFCRGHGVVRGGILGRTLHRRCSRDGI